MIHLERQDSINQVLRVYFSVFTFHLVTDGPQQAAKGGGLIIRPSQLNASYQELS